MTAMKVDRGVVLEVNPDVAADVAAVVVEPGVLADSLYQAPGSRAAL
jgi:hypothetical protein